jgi:hypothetical protein
MLDSVRSVVVNLSGVLMFIRYSTASYGNINRIIKDQT